ncbi:MAG TPA: hypothetical protein VH476_10565 [Solirubrobacterales bacterium]
MPSHPGGKRSRGALLLTATLIAVGALAPARAAAEAPIYQFEVTPSTTQAGGHPNLDTLIWVGNRYTQHIPPPSCDCQDAEDINLEMPRGVIGNPHASPQCSAADFSTNDCPPETQVGSVVVSLNAEEPGSSGFGVIAVENLVPHPGEAGLLGFNFPFLHFGVYEQINSRTESDYGLDVTTEDITHLLPIAFIEEHLWGVPAASENDFERLPAGWDSFEDGQAPPTPSNAAKEPFLSNPTTCNQPNLSAHLTVTAYDRGVTEADSPYPATTGCDQLSFNPSLYAQPTTTATDTASGLDVDLQVPQQMSPKVPSPSEIRGATVTLPPGFSINPNAADGKTSCSNTEAAIGTRNEARCPENSKVGTVSVNSSALPGPIPGYIYLGTPLPGDRYRLILTANGYNVHVKLAGSALADEHTGQVTVSFQELPQTPFSDFNMHFFGSERGLLATPTQCGTYGVSSTFLPWDSELPEQTSTQYFTLGSGPGGSACPPSIRPFQPSLRGGVADKTAGRHSPFSITLTRPDGDQDLTGLDVTTPPGFAATLVGVTYCPDATLAAAGSPTSSGLAELAAQSCPSSSQIGTASTAAGAGNHPVYLPGRVFLAGPYKGAPLSLAVVTPAVSGPYDLGNVVVRAALDVNPVTAQITAVSDPLPLIVGGIPLRLRQILVNLDRPGFALNPTNCGRFAVQARVFGDQGAEADPSVPFQVADCAEIPFGPKLSLRLDHGLKHTQNPALQATLTAGPGEANIERTVVKMPRSMLLDNAHIQSPCTKVQFAANACPPGSVLGSAKAESPLLEKPLEGPVYLASGYGHRLPDLLAALKGQVDINLDARVDSVHGALRTSFETVPDVPVTRFTLNLIGGKRGLLQNSVNLCGHVQRAAVKLTGQNNRRMSARPKIHLACGGHASRSRHRRRASADGGAK